MNQLTDVQKFAEAIAAKNPHYNLLWDYYDGEHPLVYTMAALRKVFRYVDRAFNYNWSAVVVDRLSDRLELKTFNVPTDVKMSEALDDLWQNSTLQQDVASIHDDLMVTGEAFVIIGFNEDDSIEAFHNDSRYCHAFYRSDNPKQMRFAGKIWTDDSKQTFANLYYDDRVEHYIATTANVADTGADVDVSISATASWAEYATEEHDAIEYFDVPGIPVFHFRLNARRTRGEIDKIMPQQQMLNKLLNDMMIAGEYANFRQRFAVTAAATKGLKSGADELWTFPPADEGFENTQVGEFLTTDVGVFLRPIEQTADMISSLSSIPKFYFTGGDFPSGESLRIAEAPLVARVRRYQTATAPTWAALVSRIANHIFGVDSLDSQVITTQWQDAATVSTGERAQAVAAYSNAGFPLAWIMEQLGFSQDDIAHMLDLQSEERERNAFSFLQDDAALGQLGAQQAEATTEPATEDGANMQGN